MLSGDMNYAELQISILKPTITVTCFVDRSAQTHIGLRTRLQMSSGLGCRNKISDLSDQCASYMLVPPVTASTPTEPAVTKQCTK